MNEGQRQVGAAMVDNTMSSGMAEPLPPPAHQHFRCCCHLLDALVKPTTARDGLDSHQEDTGRNLPQSRVPKVIWSDNGPTFVAKVSQGAAKYLEVD